MIAFCRAVYWSLPVPALTRLTLTLGYFVWKSATTCLRVGSQAQTVSVPPFQAADVGVGDAGLGQRRSLDSESAVVGARRHCRASGRDTGRRAVAPQECVICTGCHVDA